MKRKQAEEQMAFQASLLDSIHDAIIAFDTDLRITSWNKAAEKLYGYTAQEAIGETLSDLLRSELSDEQRAYIKEQLEVNGEYSIEHVQYIKNGRRLVVEGKTITRRDSHGKITGYVSTCWDHTERKQAEEALRISEEKFAQAFATNPAAIVMTRLEDGQIMEVNETALAMFGYSRDEVIGTSISLQRWPSLEDRSRLFQELQEKGSFQNREQILLRRSGEPFVTLGSAAILQVAGEAVILSTWLDISERKQTEDRIRQLNQDLLQRNIELETERTRWQGVIEGIADEVWICDELGRMSLINLPSITAMGLEEFKDWPVDKVLEEVEILFPDGQPRPAAQSPLLRSLKGEIVRGEEIMRHRRTGKIRYRQFSSAPIRDVNGMVTGAVAIVHDITNLKETEAALRQSRERLERAQQIAHLGSWELDIHHNRLTWSDEVYRIFGLQPQEFGATYEAFLEQVHPDDRAAVDAAYSGSLRENRDNYEIEHRVVRKSSGEIRIVHEKCEHIRAASGQIIRSVGMIHDITERKQAEQSLRDSETELKQAEVTQHEHQMQMEIQRRLLEYREQERQMIAREIHDGPVQDLSSVLFNIQFTKGFITEPKVKEDLDNIALRLKSSVQYLRQMINEMRPPSLIRFGLVRTLEVYLEEFKEKYPEIELNIILVDDGDRLSEQARFNLYRIAQEALKNAMKHGNATKITVQLAWVDHRAILEIVDNGKGFSVSSNLVDYSVKGHFGLVGMKERTEAIGGRLEILSRPKHGTTIRITVPLDAS